MPSLALTVRGHPADSVRTPGNAFPAYSLASRSGQGGALQSPSMFRLPRRSPVVTLAAG